MTHVGNYVSTHKSVFNSTRSWSWWWARCKFPSLTSSHCCNTEFPPCDRSPISLQPWHIRAAPWWGEPLPAALGEALGMVLWGTDCNPALSILPRETPGLGCAIVDIKSIWSISGFLIWSRSSLRGKNPKNLPCIINEFSSFWIPWLWALQMKHLHQNILNVFKNLKSLQNATNHFWNFTVPNISNNT